jgi:hypothetical protein
VTLQQAAPRVRRGTSFAVAIPWRHGMGVGRRMMWRALLIGMAIGIGACDDDGGPIPVDGGLPDAGGSSVVTDAGAGLGVRPMPAGDIFDDTIVHDIALTMSPDDWQSIVQDTRGDDWRHAALTYDGVVIDDVGVRPAGESSRMPGNPKQAMRVKFDAFQDKGHFASKKVIKLDGLPADLSMMRERLAFYVFRTQVPTPREAAARLTVNGDLRGHYTVIEVWDSESIEEQFPMPSGPLYRIRGLRQGAMPEQGDPYLYRGDNAATYVPYPWEPHIMNAARGDDVIPVLLNTMASGPAGLEAAMDMDRLLGYLACNAVVMNTDGLAGDSDIEDHFEYFDPSTGKLVVLPWDSDNTFGSLMETPDRYLYARFSRSTPPRIVRDDAGLRQRYEDRIRAVMATVPVAALHAEADRIYQQIRDVVYADPAKPFSNDAFDWGYNYVKSFASQRYDFLRSQLGN